VYLYAIIDRAHSYTLYWIYTAPIYRITCIALFSVVIAVLIIDIILWFVLDGKIFYPARTFSTRFFSPFLFSEPIFLSVSLPSVLFPVPICARQRKNEKGREGQKEANSGQSIIFISKSFMPFIRNPKRTLQLSLSLSFSLSYAHFQILFLFTFVAAKVGSYSRPILSPGTFRSCLGTISLKQRNVTRRYPEVSILGEFYILANCDIASRLRVWNGRSI